MGGHKLHGQKDSAFVLKKQECSIQIQALIEVSMIDKTKHSELPKAIQITYDANRMESLISDRTFFKEADVL